MPGYTEPPWGIYPYAHVTGTDPVGKVQKGLGRMQKGLGTQGQVVLRDGLWGAAPCRAAVSGVTHRARIHLRC